MKRILTTIFVAFSISAVAQSNFHKLSLGAGYGLTRSYADLPEKNYDQALYGTADFLFTPFLSLGLEVQNGEIKGGWTKRDPYNRQFKNSYRSLTANAKVQLGAFVDYNHSAILNHLKGLYLGAGIGAIQNRNRVLERRVPGAGPQVYIPFTKEAIIPLNAGINYYIPDKNGQYRFVVNANYQTTIALGEGLDGYDGQSQRMKAGKPDVYTYMTLGLKYNFGPMGVSSKTFVKY